MTSADNPSSKPSQSVKSTMRRDKVRWSLRQRLRKQLQQLSIDVFDEVDDYLFSSPGVARESDIGFLKSMRELRSKQSLFEELLLQESIALIKQSQAADGKSIAGINVVKSNLSTAFERIEIDLAVRAMQRKSEKTYSHFYKQIDEFSARGREQAKTPLIESRILVLAVLCGFQKAQHCLILPLEIRLIFAKLFEQHFILCMGKLYGDILSILNHEEDPAFVEKLYLSSSAFRSARKHTTHELSLEAHRTKLATASTTSANKVELAVADFVSELCDSHRMPLFVEKMIRHQWRSVMFLIGLNTGCDGAQWNEAKYSVLMLSAAAADGSKIGTTERALIVEQIEAGFKLAQIDVVEQETFLLELKQLFNLSLARTDAVGLEGEVTAVQSRQFIHSMNSRVQEASISPAGKRVLDKDDLNELASLLGGSEKPRQDVRSESDLHEYLHEVDQLAGDQQAQYKVANIFKDCLLTRVSTDFFEIQVDDELTSIKRSRLGLAMAIKQGDIRLNKLRITRTLSSVTILDRHLH
jgi:hypothetical protein